MKQNQHLPDDILQEVFTYLRPPLYASNKPPQDHIRALHNAALVCKIFSHHALDALWRVQYSLEPLLDLIPVEPVEEDSDESISGADSPSVHQFNLTRPLEQEDIAAFDRYAVRIKAFHETEKCPSVFEPFTVMELLHRLGRPSLLPNLRILMVTNPLHPSQIYLVNRDLKALSCGVRGQETLALISLLTLTAPNLESIEIGSGDLYYSDSFFPSLGKFPFLKRLSIAHDIEIDMDDANIGRLYPFMCRLVRLKVNRFDLIPQGPKIGKMGLTPFPLLEELEIAEWISESDVVDILKNIPFPKLRMLYFRSGAQFTAEPATNNEQVRALLSHLFDTKSNLRCLHIDKRSNDTTRNNRIAGIGISRLMKNAVPQDIETLKITTHYFVSLPNSSIATLARVFPKVTVLAISLPSDGALFLDGLVSLARQMPQLVDLEIGVVGEALDDPSSLPLLTHQLKRLCITSTRLEDPARFARSLYRIFPFAQVSACEKLGHAVVRKVEQVAMMLESMREVSRIDQERAQAAAGHQY